MFNFKTAFDRITTAYLNNELEPWNSCACFVGNLLNGSRQWTAARVIGNIDGSIFCYADTSFFCYADAFKRCIDVNVAPGFYTADQILTLERLFLETIQKQLLGYTINNGLSGRDATDRDLESYPDYENALYLAMTTTLEALKQIHIAREEDVDESLSLQKRTLVTA